MKILNIIVVCVLLGSGAYWFLKQNHEQVEASHQAFTEMNDEQIQPTSNMSVNRSDAVAAKVKQKPSQPIEPPSNQAFSEELQVFKQDLLEDMPKSTPTSPHFPKGLSAQLDIQYKGAFRALARGESSSSYAVGTLGVNPERNSIYLAGHAHHNAIAEFEIPKQLSYNSNPKEVVKAKILQAYVRILSDKKKKPKASHGKLTNRINGILHYKNKLLVTSEIWYDAPANNKDNLQVLNADDLSAPSKGMLQLEGAAYAAGYMFHIPENWQQSFNAEYGLGWSSVYSITGRYSQGPSLYTFDPQHAVNASLDINRKISTRGWQFYPMKGGRELVSGANRYQKENVSPIWSAVARARYGFIVPGTDLFIALGSNGGIHSGIGYKITQTNGNLCGGGCTFEPKDNYNYFWIYQLNDIINAENPWDTRPISYGKWILPYKGRLIGASYNIQDNMLYMSIQNAARVGDYDRPPMIVAFSVKGRAD